ncbi:MAG: heavy metal translocating P-type ATPase [Clostridia bacterium]|nr:heavy metal translocating P-type ATPase [Clostridia bacterium]
MKKHEFILKDLDCAACGIKIQDKIAESASYQNVVVNYNTLKLSFETDYMQDEVVKADIIEIVSKVEPEVVIMDLDEYKKIKKSDSFNKNKNIIRIIIGMALAGIAFLLKKYELLSNTFLIVSYMVLLYRTIKNAVSLLRKRTIDENFLVTISCIGAFLIDKKTEGLMVIFLYEIGKILEEKAVNNTRKSISELMDIRPEYANLKKANGELEIVEPDDVEIGDVIIVKQGEKIPLDGVVISGEASLDTSSLTGESKHKKVVEGDRVLSGSINDSGLIEIKVLEEYENSTISKILNLVENATDKKTKTETFVNKASRIYTPIVVGLAFIICIVLPVFMNVPFKEALYRALVFLVISCPCAIVISVPLSYFTGIGKASKEGILIKGSNYLDSIRKIKRFVFDKTGTLTKGSFGVEKIVSINSQYSDKDIIELCWQGEKLSNHPIARAIIQKYEELNKNQEKDIVTIYDYKEESGKGISFKQNDKTIKIGSYEYILEGQAKKEKHEENGTLVYISVDGENIGYIVLNDTIKQEAKDTISKLKEMDISTTMFTGDGADTAIKVAKEIGIDSVKAEMLPQDKYSELEKLLEEEHSNNAMVAFVGDGINDSPVLAISDIGFAMGGIGASSALEASDVVLMTDDLKKIVSSIKISKYTNKIIVENLVFALSVKLIVLAFSMLGIAKMWQAVFADVGVTLITIFNTIRILRYKR